MCIQFLGEKFSADLCHRMCDNCRKDEKIDRRDVTSEAVHILNFVQQANYLQKNITMKNATALLRGLKVSKDDIDKSSLMNFSGTLRNYSEDHLRRIILRMLIVGALKENFIATKMYRQMLV